MAAIVAHEKARPSQPEADRSVDVPSAPSTITSVPTWPALGSGGASTPWYPPEQSRSKSPLVTRRTIMMPPAYRGVPVLAGAPVPVGGPICVGYQIRSCSPVQSRSSSPPPARANSPPAVTPSTTLRTPQIQPRQTIGAPGVPRWGGSMHLQVAAVGSTQSPPMGGTLAKQLSPIPSPQGSPGGGYRHIPAPSPPPLLAMPTFAVQQFVGVHVAAKPSCPSQPSTQQSVSLSQSGAFTSAQPPPRSDGTLSAAGETDPAHREDRRAGGAGEVMQQENLKGQEILAHCRDTNKLLGQLATTLKGLEADVHSLREENRLLRRSMAQTVPDVQSRAEFVGGVTTEQTLHQLQPQQPENFPQQPAHHERQPRRQPQQPQQAVRQTQPQLQPQPQVQVQAQAPFEQQPVQPQLPLQPVGVRTHAQANAQPQPQTPQLSRQPKSRSLQRISAAVARDDIDRVAPVPSDVRAAPAPGEVAEENEAAVMPPVRRQLLLDQPQKQAFHMAHERARFSPGSTPTCATGDTSPTEALAVHSTDLPSVRGAVQSADVPSVRGNADEAAGKTRSGMPIRISSIPTPPITPTASSPIAGAAMVGVPSNATLREVASVSAQNGDLVHAETLIDQLSAVNDPSVDQLRRHLFDVAIDEGDPACAERQLAALGREPDSERTQALIIAYADQGDAAKAKAVLERYRALGGLLTADISESLLAACASLGDASGAEATARALAAQGPLTPNQSRMLRAALLAGTSPEEQRQAAVILSDLCGDGRGALGGEDGVEVGSGSDADLGFAPAPPAPPMAKQAATSAPAAKAVGSPMSRRASASGTSQGSARMQASGQGQAASSRAGAAGNGGGRSPAAASRTLGRRAPAGGPSASARGVGSTGSLPAANRSRQRRSTS